jgi:hypothetical protein
MTDVSTITARIVAIADDMTGVTADDQYPTDEANGLNVPFMFVEEGPAAFVRTDSNNIRVTQEWALVLWVQAFEEEVGNAETAYQAARPYLTSVPTYFWNRTRLQRGDQGLADVVSANITAHDGIQSADRPNLTYMGVRYTLSVVYDQYVDEL